MGLVSRLGRSRDSQTLFKAINYTCTLSGARRLRGCLLEPPNGALWEGYYGICNTVTSGSIISLSNFCFLDLNTITYRQDSVAELISKPQILLEVQVMTPINTLVVSSKCQIRRSAVLLLLPSATFQPVFLLLECLRILLHAVHFIHRRKFSRIV